MNDYLSDKSKTLFKLTERRVFLCSNGPVCPKCKDAQVQLIEYINIKPATWKCRICKFKFEFEPK